MLIAIDMSKHDRGRAADAQPVCRPHHLEPGLGVDLVGAKNGANLIVEDFRGRTRQRAEAGSLERGKEVVQRQSQRPRPLVDFQRRERMDMHVRRRRLHRMTDVEIGIAGVVGVDAALHTDLGGGPRLGFEHALANLGERQQIRFAAQRFARLAFGKGAELAFE